MYYSDIVSFIVAYLKPCVTRAYSEPCHYQNLAIFLKTQDIIQTLSRLILANPLKMFQYLAWITRCSLLKIIKLKQFVSNKKLLL